MHTDLEYAAWASTQAATTGNSQERARWKKFYKVRVPMEIQETARLRAVKDHVVRSTALQIQRLEERCHELEQQLQASAPVPPEEESQIRQLEERRKTSEEHHRSSRMQMVEERIVGVDASLAPHGVASLPARGRLGEREA
ncbi:hypothetical protein C8Q76DRAFT_801941 [Earliella scabrosa]|nr:hypothetical protein C8Q76DRAFT_801941 [Earliella scabrosa]